MVEKLMTVHAKRTGKDDPGEIQWQLLRMQAGGHGELPSHFPAEEH